ncbi:MAG: hypothetical protein CBC25_07915 [Pelagibacteraceae bacterium TMED65]|nr:D-glycero-D-manno-heptose 1-phosphate guanosyltransferase [Rickettsiales bacterium]MBS30372.1 D-glycero-D-manno-heptose 1-phosphate guanosyltransferase [Candidatus Neomarinimicrobiota bacterium]OUU50455.1 MAG: hypothetical protein CBC25_07915 [Pelagibacteraceae bacterium TMED65]|tara:strand:+ start:775 stop:1485 length:711 start_codon:yes stop_codon:yes gene_type:complete
MIKNFFPLILAGGKGTRLESISKGTPKPLMRINEKFFICYIFEKLILAGFRRVYISVGYKSDVFQETLGNVYKDLSLVFLEEKKPLGTGGAILNAFKKIKINHLFVLNGDSICNIDYNEFLNFYSSKMDVLMLTVRINNSLRFGNVEVGEGNRVLSFSEKTGNTNIINGGIYVLKRQVFDGISDSFFSFEEDILKKKKNNFYHYFTKKNFLDIGTPESFRYATIQLKKYVFKEKTK